MATTSPASVYTGRQWLVRSSRDPETLYTINIDPQTFLFTCTCPDHQYRQRDCKHIKAVQTGKAGRPRVRICPKPVPAPRPSFDDGDLWGDAGAAVARSVASVRQAVSA